MVLDQTALDTSREPTVLGEKSVLLVDQEPTVEYPVMRFSAFRVLEKEYEQRVKVERTIQQYRPRWAFLALGISGASFAAISANTSLVMPSASSNQQLALNITAGLLAGLSVVNMKPIGEPVRTGETRLMRRSGYETRYDTLSRGNSDISLLVDIYVLSKEDTLLTQRSETGSNGSIEVNLASIAANASEPLIGEDILDVMVTYNDESLHYEVPVHSFLNPFVRVSAPVAVLRNAPVVNDLNVITEVGAGSTLPLIDRSPENWYRVRFGGSEVFIARNAGNIEWRSETSSGSPAIFEFEDVPFGDIDVESAVPILKNNNPNDRAIIITNGFAEDAQLRQYLDRDHRLFRFYMRHALQMNEDQVFTIDTNDENNWQEQLRAISGMNASGSLFVYLSGYGIISEESELYLAFVEAPEGSSMIDTVLFESFERLNPSAVYLMNDLEFILPVTANGLSPVRSVYTTALQQTANRLLRRIPNSVILFSTRPGQSSSLYTGAGMENRRHHIFNYYWADAIKRRNTTMASIIRHLENNVDYTSRRLHDRPQEIQAFGNFTLSITE